MLEEINLVIKPSSLKQFRTYSDPSRDMRRHTVSVVFHTLITDISSLKRGDDAKEVVVIPVDKIKSLKLGFDHKQILLDYFN